MSELFDGFVLTGELRVARGTVDDHIIGAFCLAGSRNVVLANGSAGSMNVVELWNDQGRRGNFLCAGRVRKELVTAGAGVMRLCTCCLLGSRNLGNIGQRMGDDRELNRSAADHCMTFGAVDDLVISSVIMVDNSVLLYRLAGSMSDLVDGLMLARELCLTLGAINDLVIGAFRRAACRNDILLYCLAGSVSELVDGLVLARELLVTAGAINDLVIGAFRRAGSRNHALLYRLAGRMDMSRNYFTGQGGYSVIPSGLNAVVSERVVDLLLGQT